MSRGGADLDYAKEFWTIANAVTAFAIVQNISFYILVGPHKGDLYRAIAWNRPLTFVLVIIGNSLYSAIVIFCHHAQKSLFDPDETGPALWRIIRIWRGAQLGAIVVLGLFTLLIVYGAVSTKGCSAGAG